MDRWKKTAGFSNVISTNNQCATFRIRSQTTLHRQGCASPMMRADSAGAGQENWDVHSVNGRRCRRRGHFHCWGRRRGVSAVRQRGGGLEEIVVTAQRRVESAQNVGIAMSVLSGQSLADKSISYVNDLQNAVPSLQVEPAFGSSQPQFRLRGVGFIDYTSNNTSPVGVSLDGVAFALPIQTQGQLFDIDRVEVLRGPQGTLYGRNTTGGEINFISNRPTAEPHAGFSLEYGSHNEVNAEGFVSGSHCRRLAGTARRWPPNRAARGSATESPGKRWATRTRSRFAASCNGIPPMRSISGSAFIGRRINPMNRAFICCSRIRRRTVRRRFPPTHRAMPRAGPQSGIRQAHRHRCELEALASTISNNGVDLTAQHRFRRRQAHQHHGLQQAHPARIRRLGRTQFDDSDEYLNSDLNVFSQELRLASTRTGPFGWVAGVFYSNEDLQREFLFRFHRSARRHRRDDSTSKSPTRSACSRRATINFTDTLKATLGVREDHESRELIGLNTAFPGAGDSLADGRCAGRIDHLELAFRKAGTRLQAR